MTGSTDTGFLLAAIKKTRFTKVVWRRWNQKSLRICPKLFCLNWLI